MPIRDFQFFKTLKNTFAKKPLKLLTNERLIIDGSWFVKKYNISNNLIPFTSLLEKLKDTEIVWIWNGIKPKRIFYTDFAGAILAELEKKNYKAANKHYTKFLECYDIKTKNYINAHLQKHNVKCITAPYVAMAQAIYIQQNLSCYFFGPTDYLLFEGAEKLVTDFYFESDQIEIVYKNEICRALKLNANKFQELALLFGSEFCPTIPPFSINFLGQKVVEMFSYMPIVDAIKKRQDVDDEYVKKYVNTLHYLKFCPVMTVNGIQLLSDYSPRVFYGSKVSLDEIFGKRLREDFYQKMFLCEICPDILEVFVNAENRENNEYVSLSSDLLNSICKNSVENENSVIGSIDKLSIKNKTVEEYMKETFKLDVSFIDTFPVHEQVVIGRYLNDSKTQKILDSVISAYLNLNLDLSTLDKNVLYYYLNFTKDIKFCSELVCILRVALNLQHKECVFDYKNYKPLLIQFLKANNRNNVCDSLVQKMND